MSDKESIETHLQCAGLKYDLLHGRRLVIVSNRGPITFQPGENGDRTFERGGGGLVTALLGLARHSNGQWIASPMTEADRDFDSGQVQLEEDGFSLGLQFIHSDAEAYQGYYNVISNPLLWFLQHSMWDWSRAPTITNETWRSWDEGYVAINRQFAEAVAADIRANSERALVMLQDYHLYLAPRMIREALLDHNGFTLTHFIHIPWPGPEDWAMLPTAMRESLLEGLAAVDLLGLQTRIDALNFLRTCEMLLPGARVNYRRRRLWYRQHVTHVRDFPISIDVESVQSQAQAEETQQYLASLQEQTAGMQVIVRVDRTEPSKNIVRGFQAYDELLELFPEYKGKVQFLAVLVPSRLEVEQYQEYIDELMAAAGRVNVRHGSSDWEPVRVLVGESYPRALAVLQLYDVLLVNPVADGMNLVCKEGPVVNTKDGVIILSERAGAYQQLGPFALLVSPCDVHDTALAMHKALRMPASERRQRAASAAESIQREDIRRWICWQLEEIERLHL